MAQVLHSLLAKQELTGNYGSALDSLLGIETESYSWGHTLNSASGSFSPDAFAARLREIRKATGHTGAEIAQFGSITKQTFSGYLHTGRLPSASVLANWVYRLGINANWLLTGEGPMLLDQAGEGQDPTMRRVAELVQTLRLAGAREREILGCLQDVLERELGKRGQAAPEQHPRQQQD